MFSNPEALIAVFSITFTKHCITYSALKRHTFSVTHSSSFWKRSWDHFLLPCLHHWEKVPEKVLFSKLLCQDVGVNGHLILAGLKSHDYGQLTITRGLKYHVIKALTLSLLTKMKRTES